MLPPWLKWPSERVPLPRKLPPWINATASCRSHDAHDCVGAPKGWIELSSEGTLYLRHCRWFIYATEVTEETIERGDMSTFAFRITRALNNATGAVSIRSDCALRSASHHIEPHFIVPSRKRLRPYLKLELVPLKDIRSADDASFALEETRGPDPADASALSPFALRSLSLQLEARTAYLALRAPPPFTARVRACVGTSKPHGELTLRQQTPLPLWRFRPPPLLPTSGTTSGDVGGRLLEPATIAWTRVCASPHASPSDASGTSGSQPHGPDTADATDAGARIGAIAAAATHHHQGRGSRMMGRARADGSGGYRTSRLDRAAGEALSEGAMQLRSDLEARGVLCNGRRNASRGICGVEVVAGGVLRICLPPGVPGSVCEPWGELWQQVGLPLASASCFQFNLTHIALWWTALRTRPAFLTSTSDARFRALIQRKPKPVASTKAAARALGEKRAADFIAWLNSRGNLTRAGDELAPQRHRRCAVVGSGHSLRCHEPPVGVQIDGHDAVFRANGAQRYGGSVRRGQPPRCEQCISARRAGRRTSYRVNCLEDQQPPSPTAPSPAAPSSDELGAAETGGTCIIARRWWHMAWGEESFNTAVHSCCDKPSRADYRLPRLRRLATTMRFAWFAGASDAGRQEDSMKASLKEEVTPLARAEHRPVQQPAEAADIQELLEGSGGVALASALSLCQRVSVFGVGLYSEGWEADKICALPPTPPCVPRS